jgi:effector-binding domain-containing protein
LAVARRPAGELGMQYDVRLQTVTDPQPTAVVRRRGKLQDIPRIVPDACGVVWRVVRSKQITGAGRHVSLYLDEQINMEVGVELETPFAGDGEVIGSQLPAGTVATATHFGPYQQLHAAHKAIRDWCAKNGHALAGPNWEIYGHWEDAWNKDPSKIRTDIYYLLK